MYVYYSVSTNFRLKLVEPSAREVFIFLGILVEREERGGRVRRGEHDSNLARLETASELKKTSGRAVPTDINACRETLLLRILIKVN